MAELPVPGVEESQPRETYPSSPAYEAMKGARDATLAEVSRLRAENERWLNLILKADAAGDTERALATLANMARAALAESPSPGPDNVVFIARCPEHGLHGQRSTCFVCGGPVEQVQMVPSPGPEGQKRPCLFPLLGGRRCLECATCQPTPDEMAGPEA